MLGTLFHVNEWGGKKILRRFLIIIIIVLFLYFFQYFYFDSAGVVNLLVLYFSALHLAKYGLTSVIIIN